MDRTLNTDNGVNVPFTSSIPGNVLSITPNSLLAAGTKYTVILHSNSITDMQGKRISSTIHNQDSQPQHHQS